MDVRVLAATNKNPEQAVSEGQLRQDLYFRLNVFHPIHLPPLAGIIKEAIWPPLIDHLLVGYFREAREKGPAGVGAGCDGTV